MSGQSVLLDTNAYSRLMQGDEGVIRIADGASRVYLCSVVLGELKSGFRQGARYEKNCVDLTEFQADPKVVCVFSTEQTTENYGELMAGLAKAGTKIPTNDVWIGAFAKEHGAAVLSFDGHMKYMTALGVDLIAPSE